MKTVLIYDQVGNAPIHFYILEGSYPHLDGVYVNSIKTPKELSDELCDILYNSSGIELLVPEDEFPLQAVKDGAIVITCGFLV